jgi:hypothetical protein
MLLDRFEAKLAITRSVSAITDEPQAMAELLVNYTFLLHALTDALYRELLDRHHLDRRWARVRDRFLKDNNIYTSDQRWPS